jgi:hypothetical protein
VGAARTTTTKASAGTREATCADLVGLHTTRLDGANDPVLPAGESADMTDVPPEVRTEFEETLADYIQSD